MITERMFNCSIKRSKNYQSVEICQGFKGSMTEQEYVQELNTCINDSKHMAEQELKTITQQEKT